MTKPCKRIMRKVMSNIIFDVSIGQWRFRTQADIRWAERVKEAVS